jgi:oligoribonuclease NrnB/cAMP/cGMP phosphodiesterase (DHH superfamily)
MNVDPTEALVVYHSPCLDGSIAALLMRGWLEDRYGRDNVRMHPTAYGDNIPTVTSSTAVYIVDFSYDADTLRNLASSAYSVVLLDHHKTAIERLEELNPVPDNVTLVLDTERSGCQLAWDYVNRIAGHAGLPEPWFVYFPADRDLWRFEQENTKAVCAALYLDVEDLDALSTRISKGVMAALIEGNALEAYDKRSIERGVSSAYPVSFEGFTVPACNTWFLTSEIGNALAKNNPFAVLWHQVGEQIRVSLRSTDAGEDVSVIAKKYGGGGHRNAAGFTVDVSNVPFVNDSE